MVVPEEREWIEIWYYCGRPSGEGVDRDMELGKKARSGIVEQGNVTAMHLLANNRERLNVSS